MADEYSLSDVLERIYQNQLGLEAALMELTLHAEQQGFTEVGKANRGQTTIFSRFVQPHPQARARSADT